MGCNKKAWIIRRKRYGQNGFSDKGIEALHTKEVERRKLKTLKRTINQRKVKGEYKSPKKGLTEIEYYGEEKAREVAKKKSIALKNSDYSKDKKKRAKAQKKALETKLSRYGPKLFPEESLKALRDPKAKAKAWETKRKRYGPKGISKKGLKACRKNLCNITHEQHSLGSKKGYETRCRKYGPNGLTEKGLKHITKLGKTQGKKNTDSSSKIKGWETRHQRYGKRGYKISEEDRRNRISKGLDGSSKEGLSWEQFYGVERSKEIKQKLSGTVVSLHADPNSTYNTPEYHEKHLKSMEKTSSENLRKWRNSLTPKQEEDLQRLAAKGRRIHPNKLEQRLIDICEEYNLPFKFTGDSPYPGLAGKMPDFVSTNGEKKIIEIFGDYWHSPDQVPERINLFKQYGYTTLILWGHELRSYADSELVKRINNFLRNN